MPQQPVESARPRTISRLRYVGPPGLDHAESEARTRIGRYEVLRVLGKGAMGVVYEAQDPLLDRVVAVKTISAPQAGARRSRAAYLERFQREAKAAAKMQHPAIVTIFDVGVDEERGAPFMVLEYLPGETLADRLDRVRMPLGRAVQIALDLAGGLAFAHRQRIVHRDVKPANVLHAGEQRWKLADFGIARLPDSDLTQVGIFMGTPGYAPPESVREGLYTPQADVFAWGAVLYELLSGRIPYEGPDTRTTNGLVVKGEAQPPIRHDPSIPKVLSDVVMRAIDPDPTRRLRDGADAEAALRSAWDLALTSGQVSPAVLAGQELPHDKVPGGRMHGAAPAARPPQPARADAFGDEADTVLRRDLPTAEAPPSLEALAEFENAATRVLHRPELSGSAPPQAAPLSAASRPVADSASTSPSAPVAVAPRDAVRPTPSVAWRRAARQRWDALSSSGRVAVVAGAALAAVALLWLLLA